MKTNLDHIVVAANVLQEGVDFVQDTLGVAVPRGGEHLTRGTHNHVMNIGGSVFLEIVAPSPDLPTPETPRWFGLDDPHVRNSLRNSPALVAWVVNTSDLTSAVNSSLVSLGKPQTIKRGELSWDFCLPADGRLMAGGLLPYVMQWHSESHPALSMADLGCRLSSLLIYHDNPEWFESSLQALGAQTLVSVESIGPGETPYMSATLETPSGLRTLKTVS